MSQGVKIDWLNPEMTFTSEEEPIPPMSWEEWFKKDGWVLGIAAVAVCLLITAGIYLLCSKYCCITEELLVKEKVTWSQEMQMKAQAAAAKKEAPPKLERNRSFDVENSPAFVTIS